MTRQPVRELLGRLKRARRASAGAQVERQASATRRRQMRESWLAQAACYRRWRALSSPSRGSTSSAGRSHRGTARRGGGALRTRDLARADTAQPRCRASVPVRLEPLDVEGVPAQDPVSTRAEVLTQRLAVRELAEWSVRQRLSAPAVRLDQGREPRARCPSSPMVAEARLRDAGGRAGWTARAAARRARSTRRPQALRGRRSPPTGRSRPRGRHSRRFTRCRCSRHYAAPRRRRAAQDPRRHVAVAGWPSGLAADHAQRRAAASLRRRRPAPTARRPPALRRVSRRNHARSGARGRRRRSDACSVSGRRRTHDGSRPCVERRSAGLDRVDRRGRPATRRASAGSAMLERQAVTPTAPAYPRRPLRTPRSTCVVGGRRWLAPASSRPAPRYARTRPAGRRGSSAAEPARGPRGSPACSCEPRRPGSRIDLVAAGSAASPPACPAGPRCVRIRSIVEPVSSAAASSTSPRARTTGARGRS